MCIESLHTQTMPRLFTSSPLICFRCFILFWFSFAPFRCPFFSLILVITFDLSRTQSTVLDSSTENKIKNNLVDTLPHTRMCAHSHTVVQHRIHYFPFFGNHCRFIFTILCYSRILIYFESYFTLFNLRLSLLCEIFQEYLSNSKEKKKRRRPDRQCSFTQLNI